MKKKTQKKSVVLKNQKPINSLGLEANNRYLIKGLYGDKDKIFEVVVLELTTKAIKLKVESSTPEWFEISKLSIEIIEKLNYTYAFGWNDEWNSTGEGDTNVTKPWSPNSVTYDRCKDCPYLNHGITVTW